MNQFPNIPESVKEDIRKRAEKWLLDPQGGGWPYDPETQPSAPFYFQQCLRFKDQKRAFVAGYLEGVSQAVAHLEAGKSMKDFFEYLKQQQ